MNPIEIRKEFDEVLVALEGRVNSCLVDFDFPMRIDIKHDDTEYVIKCYEKNYMSNWEIIEPIMRTNVKVATLINGSLSHLEIIKWIEGNL